MEEPQRIQTTAGLSRNCAELELRLARCHPTNCVRLSQDVKQAQAQQDPTVFDWLVEIISDHGPGGREAEDRVELVLD